MDSAQIGAHREILVIRHGRRHDRLPIKFFAFGFPLVLELVPGVPAAPVFLGVSQGNQGSETGECKQNPRQPPMEISHCMKTPDKNKMDTKTSKKSKKPEFRMSERRLGGQG